LYFITQNKQHHCPSFAAAHDTREPRAPFSFKELNKVPQVAKRWDGFPAKTDGANFSPRFSSISGRNDFDLERHMDLEFSKCFAHTSAPDCRWSPNGRHLASAAKYQLIVRDENLEILHIFACQEMVEEVHWAPDSQSLLCFSRRSRNGDVVEVFSLLDTQWRASIDEESLLPGVTAVRWAPDSKHLIIVSDYQVATAPPFRSFFIILLIAWSPPEISCS
jgi:hypothetical protein